MLAKSRDEGGFAGCGLTVNFPYLRPETGWIKFRDRACPNRRGRRLRTRARGQPVRTAPSGSLSAGSRRNGSSAGCPSLRRTPSHIRWAASSGLTGDRARAPPWTLVLLDPPPADLCANRGSAAGAPPRALTGHEAARRDILSSARRDQRSVPRSWGAIRSNVVLLLLLP